MLLPLSIQGAVCDVRGAMACIISKHVVVFPMEGRVLLYLIARHPLRGIGIGGVLQAGKSSLLWL